MPSSQSTSPTPPLVDARQRRRRLWDYFLRYRGLFAAGALFLFLTNILALAIPSYLGEAIQLMRDASAASDGGFEGVRSQVVKIAGMIIVLATLAGAARIFSRITIFNAGRHIEFDIRNELYDRLATLDPRFYASMSTGDVTSRVTNDVTYVRLLYAIPFLHLINAGIAYTIAINKMVALDWRLTLWCLAPYPFLMLGIRFVIRALFEQTKIVQAQLSSLSTQVQENLAGVGVIKSYCLEAREIERFELTNQDYLDKNMRLARIRGMMDALVILIAHIGTLVVLTVGAGRVVGGEMALGTFVEFNAYVVALAFPTIAMGWVFSVWHRGLAGFERVCEILYREPDIKEAPDARPLPPIEAGTARGHVRFEGVTFGYEADKVVLHDIDLDIPAGSTVAIVGRTGSGKSTLVKLIARFYDPDRGRITIDGVPLPELELRETRSEVGFVPQEPFLFSMTIGHNIRFGLDALEYDDTIGRAPPTRPLLATCDAAELSQDERIAQAVEVAALNMDVDSFPEGLDTLVGERGVTLSGGQKQRVTIARALLVDPRILILDDALASVDTQTESVILDHLAQIMRGRTSILLTHRFNALARVDRIYVLEEGRLVEQGTHDELVERGGVYADMYHRQQLQEQLES